MYAYDVIDTEAQRYDPLAPSLPDFMGIRESVIPLPGRQEGYARVLLIGTTGSGKTTVVRQLIGTDPKAERFPSTSASRTTTSDIEIVLADGMFRAVVSFLPEDRVRLYVEESLYAAALAQLEGRRFEEVTRKLLEHTEQRFRLSYLLGTLPAASNEEDDFSDEDDLSDKEDEAGNDTDVSLEVSTDERRRLNEQLRHYLERVRTLASVGGSVLAELAIERGIHLDQATGEQQNELHDLLEVRLRATEAFNQLVDDIVEDVASRFELVSTGSIVRERGGWPSHWTLETEDRAEFIRTINRFSSNYAPNFGRLLTPVVQGIRVAGPFRPAWADESIPKLVLIDGEGLGHTPESASSVSTALTRRYEIADVILLVDHAAQPVQAAPSAALRSILFGGHGSKLILCFTHFDEVRGDNLPNNTAKKRHVLGSLDNVLAALSRQLGPKDVDALPRADGQRTFFLSSIHRPLTDKAAFTREQLQSMLETMRSAIEPPPPTEAVPVYNDAYLILGIQKAVRPFHTFWRAKLGIEERDGIQRAKWAKIKALSRRLAQWRDQDEYDTLRPVADLVAFLNEQIRVFLSSPLEWEPHGTCARRRDTIDLITQKVFSELHTFAQQRLITEQGIAWKLAYQRRGPGSTRDRAHDIDRICHDAAPVLDTIDADTDQFVRALRELVSRAIVDGGGKLVGPYVSNAE